MYIMKTTPNIIRFNFFVTALALGLATAGTGIGRADEKAVQGLFTPKDYKFVCEALIGGQSEIDLSQSALQKATVPAVRDFAQRMVQDHQKMNQELTLLSADKGAILPIPETKKSEKVKEHLDSLSGMQFDQAYVQDMVNDHKKVLKLFQKAAEEADDGDLKTWAAKSLPALAEHLRMAQSVEASLNGTKVASR
jgi:putative membrane protein